MPALRSHPSPSCRILTFGHGGCWRGLRVGGGYGDRSPSPTSVHIARVACVPDDEARGGRGQRWTSDVAAAVSVVVFVGAVSVDEVGVSADKRTEEAAIDGSRIAWHAALDWRSPTPSLSSGAVAGVLMIVVVVPERSLAFVVAVIAAVVVREDGAGRRAARVQKGEWAVQRQNQPST
ncbi:hypothetical protein CPC08DRAFT_729480 [Agrocybe pediades]|nr:hypothetical protein CPC08DRAFT_729480 [Agrocybe pediades]